MAIPKIKRFEVKIFFSTFCTYQVEAEEMDQAILHARRLRVDEAGILSNLESWENADEVALLP